MGAVKIDMLLILYVISIAQVTSVLYKSDRVSFSMTVNLSAPDAFSSKVMPPLIIKVRCGEPLATLLIPISFSSSAGGVTWCLPPR